VVFPWVSSWFPTSSRKLGRLYSERREVAT
jgi:hypothetical protein